MSDSYSSQTPPAARRRRRVRAPACTTASRKRRRGRKSGGRPERRNADAEPPATRSRETSTTAAVPPCGCRASERRPTARTSSERGIAAPAPAVAEGGDGGARCQRGRPSRAASGDLASTKDRLRRKWTARPVVGEERTELTCQRGKGGGPRSRSIRRRGSCSREMGTGREYAWRKELGWRRANRKRKYQPCGDPAGDCGSGDRLCEEVSQAHKLKKREYAPS